MNHNLQLLSTYYDILDNNQQAQYLLSKHIPTQFSTTDSLTNLWKQHDTILNKGKVQDVQPTQSLLDLKTEIANRLYHQCVFCEHRCKVNRATQKGFCNVQKPLISSEFLHMGEETDLIPSHTIFFSGCTFHCVFCQNYDISQHHQGITIAPKKLSEMISVRRLQGARNVNWVGGDPTSNLPYILHVLSECTENIPQIWNSNMYCSRETMKLLQGVIDVYLTDFKYGNNDCAHRLSQINNYWEVVTRNHQHAYNTAEVIVRHLILPNHTQCCSQPILEWIKHNTPELLINVMDQYRPMYHAMQHPDIAQTLAIAEVQTVRNTSQKLGLYLI